MKIETRCGMCSRLDEDGGHLLFNCKEIKGAWRELNMEAILCQLAAAVTAREVMEIILKLQGKEQLASCHCFAMAMVGRKE